MSSDQEKANAIIVKVEATFASWERKYTADGLRSVRWTPPLKDGCRACGNRDEGLWRVNAMTKKILDRGEALLFVAILCKGCQGNEDRRDQAIGNVVMEYLKAHESKHL